MFQTVADSTATKSSEAINAWAGLILWGEATGNRQLRDLGLYLYTTEVAAVEQYWFDTNHQVLGADFGKPFATQVFGGKFAYSTWWTAEPHEVYGINLLPLTPASIYLGADPTFVRAAFANLPTEEQRYRSPSRDDTPERLREIIALHEANLSTGGIGGRALPAPHAQPSTRGAPRRAPRGPARAAG